MAFEGFNPDEIEKAATNSIDWVKYEGTKSVIKDYKTITIRTDWDGGSIDKVTGKKIQSKLIPGLQREAPALEVYSEKLGETETGKPIVASERLALNVNEKTGKPVYSLHERSRVAKLFRYFKVNSLAELKGKPITILVRSSTKNPDIKWLGFNYYS